MYTVKYVTRNAHEVLDNRSRERQDLLRVRLDQTSHRISERVVCGLAHEREHFYAGQKKTEYNYNTVYSFRSIK